MTLMLLMVMSVLLPVPSVLLVLVLILVLVPQVLILLVETFQVSLPDTGTRPGSVGRCFPHFQVSFYSHYSHVLVKILNSSHFFADWNPWPWFARSWGNHHERKTGLLNNIILHFALSMMPLLMFACWTTLSQDLSGLLVGRKRHQGTDWRWWLGSFRSIPQTFHKIHKSSVFNLFC